MYTLKSGLKCLQSFVFENNNVHFSSPKNLSVTMVWKLAKLNFLLFFFYSLQLYFQIVFLLIHCTPHWIVLRIPIITPRLLMKVIQYFKLVY